MSDFFNFPWQLVTNQVLIMLFIYALVGQFKKKLPYTLLQFVSYINCDNFLHWYCPESITRTIYLYLGGSFTTCLFCLHFLYETYCCMSYCMMVIAGQKCMENSLRSTISSLQACPSVQLSTLSFLVNGSKGMKIGEGHVHVV